MKIKFIRKSNHLRYLEQTISSLHREIFLDSLEGFLPNKNKVSRFKKYSRRLKLIRY
jgi:hypothetical protein